ncbi:PAS domain S-box protein [Geobacter sp. FeAm09]|uniref:PAS domain S-box protein n=1 Tax=Geobacter sp. FeAm09 TaxID=2597769 RepID=UPI00143D3463|nr:PAS domain S-box protein [Geobacter sp. FeAm09]
MTETRQHVASWTAAVALCGVIFAIDLLTPPGVAVWIGYLFMPLLLFRRLGAGPVTWLAGVSTLLMVVDLLATPPATHFPISLFNRILAMIVLWLSVAFLRMHSRMRASCTESEARYDSLFNSSNDAMLIIEPHSGNIVDANPAAVSFYGYPKEQLTAMRIFDINTNDEGATRENMEHACEGAPSRFVFQHRRADGSLRSVEVSSGTISFRGKDHLFSIISDITERKRVESELQRAHAELEQRVAERTGELADTIQVLKAEIAERKRAEDALRENEERYRSLFDNSIDGILLATSDGCVLEANPEACRILGMTEEEVCGRCRQDIVDVGDQRATALLEERTRTGKARGEVMFIRKDGSRVPCDLSSSLFADREGNRRACIIFRDVSERKRTEEYLVRTSDEIRDLYNNAPCGYHSLNDHGVFVLINDTELNWLGYGSHEVIGRMSFSDILADGSREVFEETFSRLKREGQIKGAEFELVRKDGSRLSVMVNAVAIRDGDGNYVMCRSTAFDITALKQTESALRKSNERYMLAAQGASDSIWDWDLETNTAFVSSRWKEMLGYGENEIDNVMEEWMSLIHPDDYQAALETLNDYLDGRIPEFCLEYRLRHQDGSYRWVLTRGACFRDGDGNPHRMAGSHTDITERKLAEQHLLAETAERVRTEQDLREKERLMLLQGRQAAMGEMIGNIAHQWRQPLNTLGLIVQRLQLFYNSGKFDAAFLQESTQEAMKLVYHMSRTIDDFRNFFKPDKEKNFFSVHATILQTVSLITESFKAHHIEIDADTEGDVRVLGFPNEYSQVVLNILLNARDAFAERDVDDARVVIRSFSREGVSVVTIRDNAGGIPAHIMEKMFEPYFTTKGPDKGTGIGLFMAKTIIEKNMNGRLSVRNTGVGAEFMIEV